MPLWKKEIGHAKDGAGRGLQGGIDGASDLRSFFYVFSPLTVIRNTDMP